MSITTLVVIFIITSAFLNAVMELAKVYLGDNDVFAKLKPAIPPLAGAAIGIIVAIIAYSGAVYALGGFALGFLSGTMSATSYELFETFVKNRAK